MREVPKYLKQYRDPARQLVRATERAQVNRERNRLRSNKVKLERGCELCGYNANPVALDFDHRDPSLKRLKIAGSTASPERLLEEMEKCRVLCANCHRIESHRQGHHKTNHPGGPDRAFRNPGFATADAS